MDSKKFMTGVFSMLMLMVLSIGFVSCNSDDDIPEQKVTYSIKMTQQEMIGSADIQTFRDEWEKIMYAYRDALGANNDYQFVYETSNITDLNAQVMTIASRVNISLLAMSWTNRYSVEIKNETTGEMIFKGTYEPK